MNLLSRLVDGEEAKKLEAQAAVILTGSHDLSKYYPPDIVTGKIHPVYADFAARRQAHVQQAAVAAIKQANCETTVFLIGMLPRGNPEGGCTWCTDK